MIATAPGPSSPVSAQKTLPVVISRSGCAANSSLVLRSRRDTEARRTSRRCQTLEESPHERPPPYKAPLLASRQIGAWKATPTPETSRVLGVVFSELNELIYLVVQRNEGEVCPCRAMTIEAAYLLSDHRHHDRSVSAAGVAVDEHRLLPRTKGDATVHDRHRE